MIKLLASVLVLSAISIADSGSKHPGNQKGPPPEALQACDAKASGAECSFTSRQGKAVSGSCASPDTSLPLACKPEGGGKAGGPPPTSKTK